MIKVFISINNNTEVILLPVSPAEYKVTSPWKNEQVEGLQQAVNIMGLKGLQAVEFSSFFPIRGHDYPFLLNRELWGMDYVHKIESWRTKRFPVRLVISERERKILNLPVTLDEFEWNVKTDGDIGYTMKYTEFAFLDTKRKR